MDVCFETVTVDDLLVSTSGAALRLVILDACRNNPDLNEDLLEDETLVAYPAAAGTTAADGRGRNSPYTAALLSHLETPLEVGLRPRLGEPLAVRPARPSRWATQ